MYQVDVSWQGSAVICYLREETEGTFPHRTRGELLGLACARCNRVVELAGGDPDDLDFDAVADKLLTIARNPRAAPHERKRALTQVTRRTMSQVRVPEIRSAPSRELSRTRTR